jgi:hypothetical protein
MPHVNCVNLERAPLKFEMAALNLKRAINFYKFKKKKFYMQIAELDWGCLKIQIEIERRKRGGGRGSPRKPAGKKKISQRQSVFSGQKFGRPILFLDRPLGNLAK